jgi:alkylation response protein AidB-like acyl-CoA dehydrogenase
MNTVNPNATAPGGIPPHIAGNPAGLTEQQRHWVDVAARLGREHFAGRAARHDREASFPFENFRDLRAAGLLGLCVPIEHGGLGADHATAMMVVAELGRHCGATALSFSMHVGTCLWAGAVADALDMSPEQRAEHQRCRAAHFQAIVRDGKLFSQPFSEGGAAAAGKATWGTLARPARVDGQEGYLVSGTKIFASLAGAADVYAVLCTVDKPAATPRDSICLAVPADAPGVSVEGDWDPLGMRGTVSRTLRLTEVFVPARARLLPEGLYFQSVTRYPHMFAMLSATYLGLAQAVCDFTVQYLRGEVPGMPPVKRRMYPTKQMAVAEMRVMLEQTRALFLQSLRDAMVDPDADARLRLYAAHYAVMENASALAQLAIRTCGGQSMLKSLPLERLYRDARCGSLMLPLTAELCLDRLGRECLYAEGERDEEIE